MIKPKKLNKGDTVAIVSLSSGKAGDAIYKHRYELGKRRLEEEFGLNVLTMPNALKGSEILYNYPELRAKDFMEAINNKEVKAIICNIGGNDTIRLLPYIDFNAIKNNPKVFMGYSDSTVNHFMMYKAKVSSYYGPTIMCEFAENYKMHEYTKKYINEVLFDNKENITIESSLKWTNEFLDWINEDYDNVERKMNDETNGFELLQGNVNFEGELLGGCIDVFPMIIGTSIWPSIEEWKGKILLLETSDDKLKPEYIEYYLRNLVAQGIIDVINGIIIGKPYDEEYYEQYKSIYKKIIGKEAKRPDLPILYNINIGHTAPMCIFPIGQKIRVDVKKKKIIFAEKPMTD